MLGSIYMVIGSLGYVINDALVRAASEEGLDVYQALFLRGLAMAAIFAVICTKRDEHVTRQQLQRPLVARVLAEVVASAFFFAAIVQIDFANAQTIQSLVPFVVTLVAASYLREHVSGGQYIAVAVGFIGVVIVARPATDAFSFWALMAVASAAFQVVREFATRRVPAETSAFGIALLTALGVSALTGIISIFTGWGDITVRGLLYLGAAVVFLVIGYVFTIQTVRVGDLSVSAPFRYTTLLGAVLIGALFFDESPDATTAIGCVTIVVAGLFAIRLERQTSSAARAEANEATT